MRLNPPTLAIFFLSLIIVCLGVISQFGVLHMPIIVTNQPFWLATVGYLLLLTGNLIKGL